MKTVTTQKGLFAQYPFIKRFAFVSLFLLLTTTTFSQQLSDVLKKGIKYKPTDGYSVAFHIGTQVWARYMGVNPGTLGVDGKPATEAYDIGLRRTRFSMYGSFLNDKLVVYSQFGMNSQRFSSKTQPQFYAHDMWSAFQLWGEKMYLGAGLHGWAGLARLSSVSYVSNMMVDHPGFNFPNLGRTDQAGRQIGIFAKGNLSKFNYRFTIDKPFLRDERKKIDIDKSNYFPNDNLSFEGYAFYSFLDEEKFKSGYASLGYLGKKKILNIGAGFDIHPESMASINAASLDTVKHDKKLFAVDLFLDHPFNNGSVLTLYSVGYFYDFGPNHIRTYGVMNPFPTKIPGQGAGNSYYNVGTGTIVHTSLGYILPDSWQPFAGRLQPIAAVQYKDFEALEESSLQFDAGVNYYMAGHNAKIHLQYSTWPIYEEGKVDDMRGVFTCQLHVYL